MLNASLDLKGARLLLVDDTPANLKVLSDLLEGEGYDLALASDGPLALKIARRLRPELILLDVMMPGMDGYEVCRRLQADTGRVVRVEGRGAVGLDPGARTANGRGARL